MSRISGRGNRRRFDARMVAALTLTTGVLAVLPGAAQAAYSGTFSVSTNPYTFGQAPSFAPDGQVVFHQDFGKGDGEQLYRANLDGSGLGCLTCGQPAPNMVPAPRPQGDWILFHSWRGHHITFGAPGFGGMGSALYVMRPDGSRVTALTGTDASHGSGEGEDDYHAYWSPDGNHIVWAHLNWNFVDDNGQGKWDIRVADFAVDSHGPHLTNIRVVRPANGHWYETQWWAPDGSGFLYTETYGSAVNPELFFCRLTAAGCQVTRLTNDPAWDEQAIFTPDSKKVIFMSTRDHPGIFNTWSDLASMAGLTTDEDYLLILPIFETGFLQPALSESTDLYELNLSTHAVRRLTYDGDQGWIIPEFTWDPTNRFLMWTELRYPDGMRVHEPVDALTQVQQLAQFLSHPPPPDGTVGNQAAPAWYLERRTRIGRFSDAAAPAGIGPLASGPRPTTTAGGHRGRRAARRHRRHRRHGRHARHHRARLHRRRQHRRAGRALPGALRAKPFTLTPAP